MYNHFYSEVFTSVCKYLFYTKSPFPLNRVLMMLTVIIILHYYQGFPNHFNFAIRD